MAVVHLQNKAENRCHSIYVKVQKKSSPISKYACDETPLLKGNLYIASEVELPPNIIIKEIIETLSKMSPQEQQHILEYIQLFEKFRSLNKL